MEDPILVANFVSWRILEANNEEQIDTRAYTKNMSPTLYFTFLHHLYHETNITQNTTITIDD